MNYYNLNGKDIKRDNIAITIFGNRIFKDQTLYEYLIEFLLVFISPKESTDSSRGEFTFHKKDQENQELNYYVRNRVAFKRFIFFNKAKNDMKFNIDKKMHKEINDMLAEKIEIKRKRYFDSDDIKDILEDFFFGFSAVLKTRSWFAQSLLPLVPEMVFSETGGTKKDRKNLDNERDYEIIENKFEFSRKNFLARGGEVYYLHLILGLDEQMYLKEPLEALLKNLMGNRHLSNLSNFIQNEWENEKEFDSKIQKNSLSYIPLQYKKRGVYSCRELTFLLQADISKFSKLELLAKGMILQIIRLMHDRVAEERGKKGLWVMDLTKDEMVRSNAHKSFLTLEDDFDYVIQLVNKRNEDNREKYESIDAIKDAKENSYKLILKLGKEIGLIIPSKGLNARMTLNEELVDFLILSLIQPGKKMELNTFLDKLFEHFGMVIGPKHMRMYCDENNIDYENIAYFDKNKQKFQELLKNCGYLRDLSDATSIVENPYEGVKI